jgi:hypothetical protein
LAMFAVLRDSVGIAAGTGRPTGDSPSSGEAGILIAGTNPPEVASPAGIPCRDAGRCAD